MLDTTEAPKKIFANPEGSNAKQKEINRLRTVALDEGEAPAERLIAATKLLSRFGPSRRNGTVIREVIKLFITGHEFSVTERAQKLKAKLLKANGLKEVAEAELPEEPEAATTEESPTIIAGTSASDIPKTLSISFDSLRDIFMETIGGYRWRQFGDNEIDLTVEQRQAILSAILDSVTVNAVRSLLVELYKQDEKHWTLAGSFPALVRICQEYLTAHGSAAVLPPPLDPRTQELLAMLNSKRGE